MGGSTVKREDPRFKATVLTLKDWGFNLWEQSGPDPKHFGNWILIGVRNPLAIRITGDREDVNLDVMPAALLKQGASEGDWYNWDVVARAIGIPLKTRKDPLVYFHDYIEKISRAFAPEDWEQTREWLARVEEEKRRRFTENGRVRSHAHA